MYSKNKVGPIIDCKLDNLASVNFFYQLVQIVFSWLVNSVDNLMQVFEIRSIQVYKSLAYHELLGVKHIFLSVMCSSSSFKNIF